MMYMFFGVAILCVLQQVTGDCSSYCLQKENVLYKEDRETEKPEGSSTTLELVNACSFGCRMAVIDEILSCPLPANLTACLNFCSAGYKDFIPELHSCTIGCNITHSPRTGPLSPSHLPSNNESETNQDDDDESLFFNSYFVPVVRYTLTLFRFNEDSNSEESSVILFPSESSSDYKEPVKFMYVFVYQEPDNDEVDVIDMESANFMSQERIWTILQFLCFVLILVSFTTCFCLFFSDESKQKEIKRSHPVFYSMTTPVEMYTVPVKMGTNQKSPLP